MTIYTQYALERLLADPSVAESLDLGRLGIREATPQGLDRVFTRIRELKLASKIHELKLCLRLSDTQLNYLPEGLFQGLESLFCLSLIDNQLSYLPEGIFQGLTNLQALDLSNNKLSSLPKDIFKGLTALLELYLHKNQLSSLPGSIFQEVTNLQYLDLASNKLSSLPEGIFEGLTLQWLDLTYNHLSTTPAGFFESLESGSLLSLFNDRPLFLLYNNFNFGSDGQIQTPYGVPTPKPTLVVERIVTQHSYDVDIIDRTLKNSSLCFSDKQIKTLDETRIKAMEGQKTMLFQCTGFPKEIGEIVLSLAGHPSEPKPEHKPKQKLLESPQSEPDCKRSRYV